MKNISRRRALQLITSTPLAAAIVWTAADAEAAQNQVQSARRPFQPKFFTRHEYATVTFLSDLIIPKDERSGSASDAGVPEFMDFMMIVQPARQLAMRGGLAMIDRLAEARFDKQFVACADGERRQVLDEVAYTSAPATSLGREIAFFSSFRDLTATGFWTSRMGVADLQYQGNVFVREWKGCPDEALRKLGVSYDDE